MGYMDLLLQRSNGTREDSLYCMQCSKFLSVQHARACLVAGKKFVVILFRTLYFITTSQVNQHILSSKLILIGGNWNLSCLSKFLFLIISWVRTIFPNSERICEVSPSGTWCLAFLIDEHSFHEISCVISYKTIEEGFEVTKPQKKGLKL